MKIALSARWTRLIFTILTLGLPIVATAQMTFSSIVVFGTSLSDPGNAFTLLTHSAANFNLGGNAPQNTPPYDTLDESLVPSAPYAKGGHHFSNGATWIEQYAQARGLASNVAPAFQSNSRKARNYAVGGARATNYPGRVNLPQEVQAFMNDVGQIPPADALYVIEIGSNDLRDALVQFLTVFLATGDPNQAAAAANTVIANALAGISGNIQTLYAVGARKFLVWNAPSIDLTPAVTAFGASATTVARNLTIGFNQGLAANVLTPLGALPGIQIAQLDIAGQMTTIVNQPSDFALTNVQDPCVTPNQPPFTCQQPDEFFFWDGIHPTKAVHAIISQLAAGLLARYPNP